MQKLLFAFFALAVIARPAFVFADDDETSEIQIHAFLTQSFIKTTENNYLARSSQLGSFDYTEGAINFTKPLLDNLRTGLQLYASDLGNAGNFNVQLDWFYLDYRWSDYLGLRVGKIKIPFGLYNELNDVDSGRNPILLPQSIYPIQDRNFLFAQTGLELYGYLGRGGFGALDYHAYLGTVSVNVPFDPGAAANIESLNVPYVAGGRVMWETPADGLRVGLSVQALRLDANLVLTGAPTPPISVEIPAFLWVASAEYNRGNWLLSAEYSQWNLSSGNTSNPALIPQIAQINQRGYVMGSYRINNWFQPGAYYSVFYPQLGTYTGAANMQDDLAATLRFDINRFWLVKLEGHYMNGTAGLDPTVNSGIPLSALPNHWCAFLVRTTAYF